MPQPLFLTITEQVAEHLRSELYRGRWTETIPGPSKLSKELGLNSKTIENALQLLVEEGILVGQGAGRPRRIVLPKNLATPSLRVMLLLYEDEDRRLDVVLDLQHRLTEAGHTAVFSSTTLLNLKMNKQHVTRFVKRNKSDAWIVFGGSREILEWFALQQLPVLALSGQRSGLPIASVGPDKILAGSIAVRRLLALDHRRIILLARKEHRTPQLGPFGKTILKEMQTRGIQTSSYNIPDWEESVEGFHACLDALFHATPPTALIVDTAPLFLATQQFLLNRGIRVPHDISLVCTDHSSSFAWCKPSIAHISWDSSPMVRRIVRWAANVARGKEDLRQTIFNAEFVEGATVGPCQGEHNT